MLRLKNIGRRGLIFLLDTVVAEFVFKQGGFFKRHNNQILMMHPYFWWPNSFPQTFVQLHEPRLEKEQVDVLKVQIKQENAKPEEDLQQMENDIFYEELEKSLIKKHKEPQKKIWTIEEDQRLLVYVEEGKDYSEIYSHFQDATAEGCLKRYERIKKVNDKWPPALNSIIKQLVEEENLGWVEVSRYIKQNHKIYPYYNPKKIRQRYLNYLKEGLSRKKWSVEDDLNLVKLSKSERNKSWSHIALKIPGRSELDVKNRYNSILQAIIKKATRRTKHLMKKIKNNT